MMQKVFKVFCTTWSQETIFQRKGSIFLHWCANNNTVERRGILLCYVLLQCEPTLNLEGSQIVLESDS